MASLQDRLRLTSHGDDMFQGWAAAVPPRIYGGETAAQAIVAADATVSGDRVAHAIQCTYLSPGDPTLPVCYAVSRTRDGRSFSTRTVTVRQADVVIQKATVGYHVVEDGFDHQQPAPVAPGPEGLCDMREYAHDTGQPWGEWAPTVDDFELRPVEPDRADPLGRRQLWSRFDLSEGWDGRGSVFITYASDMTMLASVRLPHEPSLTKTWLTTTLTHTVYFHRSHDARDWLLWDHYSPAAGGARGLAIAHAYDERGRLVASAVQEGLARPGG